jgi:hypothetical protein
MGGSASRPSANRTAFQAEPNARTEQLANPFRPGNGVAPPYLAGRDPLLAEFQRRPAVGEVVGQAGLGHGPERDEPLLAALASDPEVAVGEQVTDALTGELGQPQPRVEEQGDDQPITPRGDRQECLSSTGPSVPMSRDGACGGRRRRSGSSATRPSAAHHAEKARRPRTKPATDEGESPASWRQTTKARPSAALTAMSAGSASRLVRKAANRSPIMRYQSSVLGDRPRALPETREVGQAVGEGERRTRRRVR